MTAYLRIFTMEMRKFLSYRADFWVNFIGQTLSSLVVFYWVWKAIYEYQGVDQMNGLTLSQMILYYLVAPITLRIVQGENMGNISREIYDGGLNKYLLYPVNYYFYKISTYLAYSFFYFLQLLILLVLFKLFSPQPEVLKLDVMNISMYLLAIIPITILYFFLCSLSELVAFWAEYVWSLGVIIRFITGFLGGAMIPLVFFPQWGREFLSFTPFPYIVAFPVGLLTHGVGSLTEYLQNLGIILVWIGVLFSLSYLMWKRGNRHYTGVGI